MKSVSTLLTRGLPAAEKKEIDELFNNNERLLLLITEALNNKLKVSMEEQRSKSAFTSNAWPYFQADSNGYQRALSEIITLLQLREKSDHDR